GSGLVTITAPANVQFSLDHGHWQSASPTPIKLPAGSHQIAALSGIQNIELKDKETLEVKVAESQIEKLVSSGVDAVEKKDYRKGQKILDKAVGLCGREKKQAQRCTDLSIEMYYQLGQAHQAMDKITEAMNSYQQVVNLASSKAHEVRRSAAQHAIDQMLPT